MPVLYSEDTLTHWMYNAVHVCMLVGVAKIEYWRVMKSVPRGPVLCLTCVARVK